MIEMTLQNNVSELMLQKLAQTTNLEKVGLLDGLAGESLYYFYRSEVLEEEAAYEKEQSKIKFKEDVHLQLSGCERWRNSLVYNYDWYEA